MSEVITEYRNENTKNIDILPTIEIVRKMNEEDKLVALAVEEETENIAAAVDLIAKQFLKGVTFYCEDGDYNMASFHLHQSAENFLRTIPITFILYGCDHFRNA